jgi:hypothetical protein
MNNKILNKPEVKEFCICLGEYNIGDLPNFEHLFTLKVIETALIIIGFDSSKDSNNESKSEINNISN